MLQSTGSQGVRHVERAAEQQQHSCLTVNSAVWKSLGRQLVLLRTERLRGSGMGAGIRVLSSPSLNKNTDEVSRLVIGLLPRISQLAMDTVGFL